MKKVHILFIIFAVFQYAIGAPHFSMTKISCSFNSDFLVNASCQLKPINRHVKHFKIKMFILKPLNSVQIRIRNLKKSNSNRYMPGVFDITKDVCEMTAQNSSTMVVLSFLNLINRGSVEKLLPLFHPCPYQGFVEYEEVEDQLTPSISILEAGEYQTDVTITSMANIQYFNLKTFFMINSRKLW